MGKQPVRASYCWVSNPNLQKSNRHSEPSRGEESLKCYRDSSVALLPLNDSEIHRFALNDDELVVLR